MNPPGLLNLGVLCRDQPDGQERIGKGGGTSYTFVTGGIEAIQGEGAVHLRYEVR
jgi:hypothetical protein